MSLQTRQQRIVRRLEERLRGQDLTSLRSRARSLPAMLQRHGPHQVLLFLQSKEDKSERELANLLCAGVAVSLDLENEGAPAGRPEDLVEELGGLDVFESMIYRDAALESAAWLKRLIEARTELASAELAGEPS